MPCLLRRASLCVALLAGCSTPAPPDDGAAHDVLVSDEMPARDASVFDAASDAPLDAPTHLDGGADVRLDAPVFDTARDALADIPTEDLAPPPDDAPTDAATDDAPVPVDVPPPEDIPTACPPPDWDGGLIPTDAAPPPTLSADIQPIFDAHCSCHQTGSQLPILLPGLSYDQLVCARLAVPCPSARVRVIPGDPGHSGLYLRVAGGGCYDQMPLGLPPLPADDIARIAAWIRAGTPR